MSSLSHESRADAGGRLLWSLRHYWRALAWVALIVLVATAVAVFRVQQAAPVFRASASVIAAEIAHDPATLPRLAEAVAAQDEVIDDAMRRADLTYTRTEFLQRHIEILPLEENILVEVVGKSTDSSVAVKTANSMAAAMTDALNEGGPGVGEFRVFSPAVAGVPQAKSRTLLLYTSMGQLAAIAGVLAVAGLLLAIRRPVIAPSAARSATGLDVLAVVERRDLTVGEAGHALAALAHVLGERHVDRVALTAPAGSSRERQLIAHGLVQALGTNDAAYVPPVHPQDAPIPLDNSGITHLKRERVDRHSGAVVVDGVADEGGTASVVLPRQTRGLVVVVEGQSEAGLMMAVERLPRPEIVGLVFVRTSSGRRAALRRRAGVMVHSLEAAPGLERTPGSRNSSGNA